MANDGAWFRDLALASSDAIVRIDRHSTVLYVNPAMERLFGWKAEDLVGRSLTVLVPERLRAPHRTGLQRYVETGVRRIPWSGTELPALHRDGHEFVVEVAFTQQGSGDDVSFVGVLRDRTAQRRHVRRLTMERNAIRTLALAADERELFALLLEDVCSALDWPWGELWRRAPGGDSLRLEAVWSVGELSGSRFAAMTRTASFEMTEGLPARSLATPGTPLWVPDVQAEPEFVRRDAAAEAGLRTALMVPFATGEVSGVLAFFGSGVEGPDDELLASLGFIGGQIGEVLRRRKAEAEARDALAQAREAVRDREDVLAVVSHDLRGPLATIDTTAAWLEEEAADDEPRRRALGVMRRSVARMESLISDLLDASRLRGGRLTVTPSLTSVAELLADVRAQEEPRVAEAGLSFVVDADGVDTAWLDRARIAQVLHNLVDNAIKFTSEGGITVTSRESEAGVRFSVDDTGCGLDPADLPYLFERFWQGNRRRVGGTGLGLAISRGIVEAHGGRIWAEPAPGGGASFRFELPSPPADER